VKEIFFKLSKKICLFVLFDTFPDTSLSITNN